MDFGVFIAAIPSTDLFSVYFNRHDPWLQHLQSGNRAEKPALHLILKLSGPVDLPLFCLC